MNCGKLIQYVNSLYESKSVKTSRCVILAYICSEKISKKKNNNNNSWFGRVSLLFQAKKILYIRVGLLYL